MDIYIGSLLGLLIGSFLTVVVARVPSGQSVLAPRSHCPACGYRLRALDNIPVLSWVWLKGRCRDCDVAIPCRYPALELGTALVFGLVAWRVDGAELAGHLAAAAGFVALTAIDLETKRLPDKVTFCTFVLAATGLGVAAVAEDRYPDLFRAGAGAAIGFAALGLIHWVAPRGLGFGDVKLALSCGLVLGWHGLADVLLGLYFGFLLGAVVGVALVAAGRVKRRSRVAFGPFLIAGAMAQALFGDRLADAVRAHF